MRKPFLRFAAVLLLCLAVLARASDGSRQPAEETWSSALSALQSNDAATAERLFTQWIAESEKAGIRSPEAHYNLGLAYWNLKRPGPSVYHFLKSTTYSSSPWKRLSTLNTLADIEKEIGVRDGVAVNTNFKAHMTLDEDWLLFLITIAFWGLVGAGLLWWLQGNRAKKAARQIAIVPAIFLLVSLLGYAYRATGPSVGVLDGELGGVNVFRIPEEKADNKLVELPAGTIVLSGRTQNDFIEIYDPVSGWVSTKSYQTIR